jgi:hypothetical protein
LYADAYNKPQKFMPLKGFFLARCQWLMPAILASWEAKIRRIEASLGKSSQDPISKITRKNGLGVWLKQ